MAKTTHVHKFRRHTYKSGNTMYFCALPDCNAKIAPNLTLGKRSICWRCGDDFIMNEYSIRLAKPHCNACHKPKNATLDEIPIDGEKPPFVPLPVIDSVTDLRSRMLKLQGKSDVEEDI